MAYRQGAPRPVQEVKYGQLIEGVVDRSRKYLLWRSDQGINYADISNFMLKSDLDAIYDRIIRMQQELLFTKKNIHEAKMRVVDTSPQTISGKLRDDAGYTYTYSEKIESEGHAQAKMQASALQAKAASLESELNILQKRWSKMFSAAGYPITW
jgi:hypothetical protein